MLKSGTTSKTDQVKLFKFPGLEKQKRRRNRKRKRSHGPRSLGNAEKIRKERKTKADIQWRYKKPELCMEVETSVMERLRKN